MSGVAEHSPATEIRSNAERQVLFLQGPLSPLYKLTGDRLEALGFGVHRINFCAGDWLHWHGKGCVSFKRRPTEWPAFIEDYLRTHGITDLVLHGDQRLYHRVAIEKAIQQDVYVAVTELGALRPGWMTLERNGLSTLSHFPSDPVSIMRIAEAAGQVDLTPKYPSSFWLQTAPDVVYNLTNVFLKPLFPAYQRHTIYPPIQEYLRGAVRLLKEKRRNQAAEHLLASLREKAVRYYVLPLQLEGDFQLRRHSPFDSFEQVLEIVFQSLAEEAPEDVHIVLKSHPLDVGFEDWPGVSKRLADRFGVGDRVHFLDGGGLAKPFEEALGVVTLNSTAGLEALQAGLPVKTLVPAHYDIADLTHQGDLATFWHDPVYPDTDLLSAYIQALAASTQVRGSIHNAEGVVVAADNIARKVAIRDLNSFGSYVDPPPRLARARALGVPL
ncbi:capsular polysaccharide biosynthesis/export protein [Stappia aggregata IAM 12614]|uniref:Capsular polysaccharide biosynthesis/export protein n=1 Tax=Roseibium aggregatum (strain ATCC 25650 / DSM 13394 / JCM 20685 / NBRC 16684 / NCIMB 2208 / IAM 12614 / B1) TaxID=384765 RepID=A0NU14_ROSAI|nr:capsular biosynthesis protein [Roseibium aggregatum]EAV43923.1 capsular polysaccharide biosynthesis/export protein [Stappia aggregata IAM 12614] [Roseibium aggregatum IAM 12614]